jgi:asparagine synthase (glutamine-hydrolysing)
MCGIAGALDLRAQREFPQAALRAMGESLMHRGPDGDGLHSEPGFAVACRRLSLVDVDGGAQPMSDPSTRIWVAFNGELFNDDVLRESLQRQGRTLKTKCDTELWLHLWELHQESLLQQTKGQYAVSLWDRERRTLLLARDRIGICPLYIAEHDGWLLWASEIKALFASGMITPQPDPLGVDTLFSFRCVGTRRTCFQGVRSLAPGHYLLAHRGQYIEKKYTDVAFADEGHERTGDINSLTDELESLLRGAVARRLRGDVPVASYLSGGLDSSLVLSLVASQKASPTAFTIGFDGAGVDERSWATQAAKASGAKPIHIPLDRRAIADEYPGLIMAAEAPVIDTSTACLLRLAREVRGNGFKAVLSGEGADEAFAGYVWYRVDKVMQGAQRYTRGLAARAVRGLAFSLLGGGQAGSSSLDELRPPQHDLHQALRIASAGLYHPDLRSKFLHHDPYLDLDLDLEKMRRLHPMHRAQYLDYKLLLPGLLLHSKGDRVAMSNGVEVRYPFLDEDVIDFAASLAPSYKLHGMTEKWLLRQVARKVLPTSIATRTKKMFTADLSPVLLGRERPRWVDQLLSPESLRRAGWFDAVAVSRERRLQSLLPPFTLRRVVMDATLTGVVATQLWHHQFISGGLCELPTRRENASVAA